MSYSRLAASITLTMALLAVACGDDPKPATAAKNVAPDKCNALLDDYCARLDSCSKALSVADGANYTWVPALLCKNDMNSFDHCEKATAVPEGYDKCYADLQKATCGDLYQSNMPNQPLSCGGIMHSETIHSPNTNPATYTLWRP